MAKARTAKQAIAQPGWIDAGEGYQLGIRDGAIVARKDGAVLTAVPKTLKDSALVEQLSAAVDFLEEHARTCLHTVEMWMLRSLPVPRAVLQSVLRDDAWATVLRDAWVVAIASDGSVDRDAGGFFRGVDPVKGIGVVDRDGETTWLSTAQVMVPHPVLLDEIDDLRELAVQIGATQGLSQLFRETFAPPATAPSDPLSVATFAGAEFSMLSQATNLAKRLGYRVSGGAAVARVLEGGKLIEARFDIGDGDPMYSTATGELAWVDDKQRPLAVVDVPPVAFSEGMRMASLIHAKRPVEGGDDDA